MSHVVFLRAANVGGKNTFRPSLLAASLSDLGVVNIGAAGTFVVRERATPAAIRKAVFDHLPFVPEIAIRPANEILELVERQPFKGVRFTKKRRGWAAVLCGPPKTQPSLPIVLPPGKNWSVRFDRIEGAFALGLWQLPRGGFVFPSVVVERAIGVASTTRWWETFERIAKVIEKS